MTQQQIRQAALAIWRIRQSEEQRFIHAMKARRIIEGKTIEKAALKKSR